jgi:hypothetical protein
MPQSLRQFKEKIQGRPKSKDREISRRANAAKTQVRTGVKIFRDASNIN